MDFICAASSVVSSASRSIVKAMPVFNHEPAVHIDIAHRAFSGYV